MQLPFVLCWINSPKSPPFKSNAQAAARLLKELRTNSQIAEHNPSARFWSNSSPGSEDVMFRNIIAKASWRLTQVLRPAPTIESSPPVIS